MKKIFFALLSLSAATVAFAGGEACQAKAKCNDKSAKAGCADMAKCNVKCDLPCRKDAKAGCAGLYAERRNLGAAIKRARFGRLG